jgi:hypothetical protein
LFAVTGRRDRAQQPRVVARELRAAIVFEKYGDHYTLREVWMGGGTGVELIRTRADQKLAQTPR